ncbi:hypothetical protein VTN00DRAFT_905 [Thermoascus crustaceus]|uniref:uncharacterized protein n=1 Tax=Thermoascus crustaceus TaxID=5088 RepID=UPI003742062E
MAPPLNIIALISGGKDSLYSILHCIRNGHDVVALANLHPPYKDTSSNGAEQEEDIDSFMYQTIGHSVIPLYETALGIPLYRAPITGGAVDTSRIYRHDYAAEATTTSEGREGDKDEDETESLIPLLRRIMREHPEANAVSAGAILSTYQRTRIENVAGRLGLVPLAWLWMYPTLPPPVERAAVASDAGLLEDMAACGCEARIIKVASGGLDEGVLWGDVASSDGDVRRRIVKGMRRFAAEDLRGAVLGEGGEYETLALDGPGFLWKQRIVVEEREVKVGDGGVGYVRLKGAKCLPKSISTEQDRIGPQDVRRPALLDEKFVNVLGEIQSRGYEDVESTTAVDRQVDWNIETALSESEDTWTISNVTAPEAGPGAGKQMKGIANKLNEIMKSSENMRCGRRGTEDIVFATVLLRSMGDFASINGVYATLFKKPNPPARATVACGDTLPEGVEVMVSVVVDLGPRDMRQALHVQSRSYWAPANIGPYSQAITVPSSPGSRIEDGGGLVYIAGQIPLEPASMEIAEGLSQDAQTWFKNYALHAVLSLQHLWRIGAAMQVDWWLGAVAFLAGEDRIENKARVAWDLWERMHAQGTGEDDEDEQSGLDAWDIKYGRRGDLGSTKPREQALPNFAVAEGSSLVPPFFAVQVSELPRGSDIEWQGLGSRCEQVEVTAEDRNYGQKIQSVVNGSVFLSIEIGEQESESAFETSLKQAMDSRGRDGEPSQAVIYTAYPLPKGLWKGQVVPCKSVWGPRGRRLAAAIALQTKR